MDAPERIKCILFYYVSINAVSLRILCEIKISFLNSSFYNKSKLMKKAHTSKTQRHISSHKQNYLFTEHNLRFTTNNILSLYKSLQRNKLYFPSSPQNYIIRWFLRFWVSKNLRPQWNLNKSRFSSQWKSPIPRKTFDTSMSCLVLHLKQPTASNIYANSQNKKDS